MKIGLDASILVYQGSGVANYTYNLIKNLLLSDKKNEYRIFYSSLRKPKETLKKLQELKKLGGKVFIYHFPPKFLNLIWGKFHILPIEWFIGKCDIIFFSDFLRPPTLKRTKGITTIHDLTWKIYPQYHTKEVIEAHKIKLEKTIKYNDEIIVDSENTKNDLFKYYPQINKNKVHVIYPGVDEKFKKLKINPLAGKEKLKIIFKKYLKNVPSSTFHVPRYILYVGAIEPRKNLDIAIKLFHKLINSQTQKPENPLNSLNTEPSRLSRDNLKKQIQTLYQKNNSFKKAESAEPWRLDLWQDLKFLIIGKAGWKNEKIFSLVKELKLENKVLFLGYVEDNDLPYFYSNALATIYLSEYEGFGIPPLESAYCGTPVLLYKNSSLKELFNNKYPYTEKGKELETLIYLIKNKVNPKKYLKKNFSYKKTAEEFLKLIKK